MEDLKRQIGTLQQQTQLLQNEKDQIILDCQAQINSAYGKGYTKGRDEEKENRNRAIHKDLEAITLELRMQGCSSKIRVFDGGNSEKYQLWLQDMERYLTQLGSDDARARILTLQTLVGPAADFATREIRANPAITWEELKVKLDARYNDMADLAFARQKLRRMTQSRSESVQNYFERLMVHARHAYGETQLQNKFVQQQLVEIFLDGLLDDHMVRRLIRSKPSTLDKALELATAEQQAKKTFDLRRVPYSQEQPMPMEINVMDYGTHDTDLREIRAKLETMGATLQEFISKND